MALGRARLEQPSRYLIDERPLAADEIDAELARLQPRARRWRAPSSRRCAKNCTACSRSEVGEFIDAHSLILADRELNAGLADLIRVGRYRASAALKMQRDRLVAVFEAMDDPYLRSRKEDIDHVIGRVQDALARESSAEERKIAARVGEILVSDTVAPSELVPLAEHGVLGVVLTSGSPLSHSAILARSLRLPMIVAAHEALAHIQDDDLILIDGERGEVVVHPTAQDIARYRSWQRDVVQRGKRLALLRDVDTRTRDGVADPPATRTPSFRPTSRRRARAARPASASTAPSSCSCSARNCPARKSSSSPTATSCSAWAACRSRSARSILAPTRPTRAASCSTTRTIPRSACAACAFRCAGRSC